MEKTIISYIVVDELGSRAYKLIAAEFAERPNAETVHRSLQDSFPASSVLRLQTRYNLMDPLSYFQYYNHQKRLV
ncbi:MAG: hypothetical protein ACR2RB_20760 [Gammaproteobacteria bacterium]